MKLPVNVVNATPTFILTVDCVLLVPNAHPEILLPWTAVSIPTPPVPPAMHPAYPARMLNYVCLASKVTSLMNQLELVKPSTALSSVVDTLPQTLSAKRRMPLHILANAQASALLLLP